MSMIFHTKEWMTVAQLVHAWARELAAPGGGDPQQFEKDLLHTLMEDIVNGRLDNSGPFRENQQSGLRLITPDNRACLIAGHQILDLAPVEPINRWLLDYVLVAREAALDFAERRQLSPPSWWPNGIVTPTTSSSAGASNAVHVAQVESRALGKTPRYTQPRSQLEAATST